MFAFSGSVSNDIQTDKATLILRLFLKDTEERYNFMQKFIIYHNKITYCERVLKKHLLKNQTRLEALGEIWEMVKK